MRVLHISDLHFGNHNDALMHSLEKRVEVWKPDVIVCTGDLADTPDQQLHEQAHAYLERLRKHCQDKIAPVIVTPGNHDRRTHGIGWTGDTWTREFGDYPKSHWFEEHGVWIYAFDSAWEGSVGGAGFIQDSDFVRFHDACAAMKQNPRFASAFKIALLHHHPLPVNHDYGVKDRLLTLSNAGAFLSALLAEKIDLVLHGHEHLQCNATLRSALGGNEHTMWVVSLGSTLVNVSASERNWCGLLDTSVDEIAIRFHASTGKVFDEEPGGEPLRLRESAALAAARFEACVRETGYVYHEVASITSISMDGDASRHIEYGPLVIHDAASDRRRTHVSPRPATTGYHDLAACRGDGDPVLREQQGKFQIDFQTPHSAGAPVRYSLHWWLINCFAMDADEARYLYGVPMTYESTQYVVRDPVEELTVAVRFPEGFEPTNVTMLVTEAGDDNDPATWLVDTAAQDRLRDQRALRYYESLNVASARIRHPRVGRVYGIRWDLPRREADASRVTADTLAIRAMMAQWKMGAATGAQPGALRSLLSEVTSVARQVLMRNWAGPVEVTLHYFDAATAELRFLDGVLSEDPDRSSPVTSAAPFRYGRGIAGRAFKINSPRIYVRQDTRSGPGYYEASPGQPPHESLVSFPLREPTSVGDLRPRLPYGVLNVGSRAPDCLLALLADDTELIDEFHEELNERLLNGLRDAFLPHARGASGGSRRSMGY